MKEITYNETSLKITLIKAFGIAALALLVLLSIADAVPFVYITNSGSNNVSVIDTSTIKVTSTLDVSHPIGVAASPDGKKVYVTNSGKGNVTVIDTATNNVIATVKDNFGDVIAVSPDGKKVYVDSDGVNLSVIDAATNKVSSSTDIQGYNPNGIAVNNDGTKLYVSTEGWMDSGYGVSIVDTENNSYIGDIALPIKDPQYRPSGVAVNPTDTKVYMTWSDGTVSVTDVGTNTVIASVPVGIGPRGVAVSPDGKNVYVTNNGNYSVPGNTISVIDTATNKVTATVNVGEAPEAIAVAPDGSKVYVTNSVSNSVSVIDIATNTVTATVPVGGRPLGIAIIQGS